MSRSNHEEPLWKAIQSAAFLAELLRWADRSFGQCGHDVVQETIGRLIGLDRRGKYDPRVGTPLGYSKGVAKNVYREMCRKDRNEKRSREKAAKPIEVNDAPRTSNERWDELAKAMLGLSKPDQEILNRYYGIVDHPLPTPMSDGDRCRLSRARARLRAMASER